MRKRAFPLWLVLVLATVLQATCSKQPEPPAKIDFKPNEFVSSKRCGDCHKDIYSAWKTSLHARSAVDPVFLASFHDSLQDTDGKTQDLCTRCHAPTVVVSKDYEMKQSITRDGVNCDFCHSLKNTDLSNSQDPFVLQVGAVKFGPVPDAVSTGHQVAYSKFHTSALICAGCHEYKNEHGAPVLSTYSEWEQYQSLGGDKTCQKCHMPLVMANIVDPKVKRVEGGFVNLHQTPGGHSLDQLAKSLRMRISRLERKGTTLKVWVKVSNEGAGHRVPTGSPTRKVILSVKVVAGQIEPFEQHRLFQRPVLNAEGKPIELDSLVFTEAQKVGTDTRIAPMEERTEQFSFKVPADTNLVITASLTYEYSPQQKKETETRIKFATDSKTLRTEWSGS